MAVKEVSIKGLVIKELDTIVGSQVSYETYTSKLKELQDFYPNLYFKITYSGIESIQLSEDYIKKVLTTGEYEVYKSRILQVGDTSSEYYGDYTYFQINVSYDIYGTNKVSELESIEDMVDNLGLYPSLSIKLTKDITRVYNKLKTNLEELVSEDVVKLISKLDDYTMPELGSKEYYNILVSSKNINETNLERSILSLYLKESINEELVLTSNPQNYYFTIYNSIHYSDSITVGHDSTNYSLRVRYILGEESLVVEKHVNMRRVYDEIYNISQGIKTNNVKLEDDYLKELGLQEIFNDKLSNINEVLQLVRTIRG